MINPNVATRLYDLFDKPKTKKFVNRTGATLNKGDVVAVDITGSDGDVETLTAFDPASHADTAHPFANVIATATAHLKGWIFAVCVDTSVADNAVGTFCLSGYVDVELAPSGTSNVAAGKRFTATNGQTYASLVTDGTCAIGMAVDSGSDTAATTRKCLFWGGYSLFGSDGAAA